uniref:FCH and mu domain containing endocytic adaptor 1 n=1 Tax=Laticauda laticaudata TaxID=8630 RepID=A0A8C5RMT5_LATLA
MASNSSGSFVGPETSLGVCCAHLVGPGEKNQGFDVLYHNMKHGQISAKELADFVRERAAVEEAYAKSMVKMSKMAGNSTQLGTFAPLWEVFRISSDKLALCHAELVKKLQDLLKEIGAIPLLSKDEVAGTLEAVQQLQGAAQHLPKAKEAFHSRCQELERLRREGASQKEVDKAELKSRKAVEALRRTVEKYNAARADFEQKMLDSAVRFQEVEESHLQHLKALVGSYIHSVEDTHVQIGQVQEEFKQNMENIGVETLLRNFAEGKGTGCTPPGEPPPPGQPREAGPRMDWQRVPISSLSRGGIFLKTPPGPFLDSAPREHSSRFCSSSDSDYDDEEPPKFYIRIKPVQPPERVGSAATSVATEQPSGLPLGAPWSQRAASWLPGSVVKNTPTPAKPWGWGADLSLSPQPRSFSPAPLSALTSSQSTSALTERGLFTPSEQPQQPPALGRSSPAGGGEAWLWALSCWVGGLGGCPKPLRDPALLPCVPGVSRGPSPVVLGSQGALPVATAFTEYIHAYFKGQKADSSCLVKVTGELTMSFPAGIVRVFSSAPPPPVLSFRLLHTAPIEQFLPNASLLFSDSSQSDPSRRDFWLNMAALTGHLQKQAEQSGAAPYYNVTLLRYQYSRQGPQWAPLQLSVSWECGPEATRVSVDYRYNASALASAVALTNVQVLLPIEEPVANVQPQPKACWNLEEKRLLWRLLDVPSTQGQGGSGRLLASWEPLDGPSRPSPVAAQFTSEGSTVSGADVELVGSGYRMSLVKKRFATGEAPARLSGLA